MHRGGGGEGDDVKDSDRMVTVKVIVVVKCGDKDDDDKKLDM